MKCSANCINDNSSSFLSIFPYLIIAYASFLIQHSLSRISFSKCYSNLFLFSILMLLFLFFILSLLFLSILLFNVCLISIISWFCMPTNLVNGKYSNQSPLLFAVPLSFLLSHPIKYQAIFSYLLLTNF